MRFQVRGISIACLIMVASCQDRQTSAESQSDVLEYDPKRVEQIEAGAVRAHEDMQERINESQKPATTASAENANPTRLRRWVVNMQFSGCPEASDWFSMQEIIQSGDVDKFHLAVLPRRCRDLPAGTRLVAPPHGKRETLDHNGITYEQFSLEDGTKLWGDGMDEMSTSDLGSIEQ